MSEEIGDVGQKQGSGRSKSLRTEKNIKLVREMILSQEDQPGTHSTFSEVARELNTDCQSLSCVIKEDLYLNPLRKLKVQKLTDSTIEKRMNRSRKLLSKYTQRTLQTAFFSDEKILKFKQLHNSYNNVVYVPKKVRKVEVPAECLLKPFPSKQWFLW